LATEPPRGAAETRRRLRLVCRTVLIGAPLVGATATQFIAWRLGYHPVLGDPALWHVYWPWKFLVWMRAPWADQAISTFLYVRLGLYAVAGAVLLAVIRGMGGRQTPQRHGDVHGTARFATEAEIREAGLLPARADQSWPGVYVGGWMRQDGGLAYLRHNGPEHVRCLGPLRSGKAVACVVPTLTSWPHSTLVYDEKGELWEYSSGWRKREGGNVVLRWEPAAGGDTIAWNALDEVRLGSEHEYGDLANIVEVLADPGTGRRDQHFDAEGSGFLIGVALHVLYEQAAQGRAATLADVSTALSDPARSADQLYRAMVGNRWQKGKTHPQVAQAGRAMLNKEARERAGVHSTASRFVGLFRNPIVARNTQRSDFCINDLMNHERPVSLYLVTRGQDKLTMRPLLRLFLTMAMDRLCSADMKIVHGEQASPHHHRLLVLVDEFASLGKMERFQDAMSKCAGYGIKCFLLAQDREQIIDAYGTHESITSHCHVKALFAPTNGKTAEWVSEMLGRATVVVQDVSESGAKGWGSKSFSRTFRTIQRPLLTADEVMRLRLPTKGNDGRTIVEPGEVLIHVGGRYPIRAVQSLFFRDPEFVRRVGRGRVSSDTLASPRKAA
jgi:type IV secretion system protein VirD4